MIKNNKTNQKLKSLLIYYLPVVVWAIIIFSFSAKSVPAVSVVHWQDFIIKKTIHMVEYGILTLLLFRALKNSGNNKKNALIYSFLIAIVYGATDELHQSFTPGREPRIRDVFFDGTGSVLMVYFISNILAKSPERIKQIAIKLDIV